MMTSGDRFGSRVRSLAGSFTLPAVALAALASPAFAGASFPPSFSTAITTPPPSGSVFTIPSGVNTDELKAVDGVKTGYSFFAGSGASVVVQYTLSFASATVPLGGDLHVIIYNWTIPSGAPTTTLTDISWVHGSESATWNGVNLAFTNGDTLQVVGANDLSNYTTVTGSFDRALANTLVLTFGILTSGNGDSFTFDAVSNPEPGTLALYGLGMMGLGAVVLRRRRAAKAKQPA